MTDKVKLAQKHLTLLQLVEKFGNVSKACQLHKVSRSQFCEYKLAFQQHGLDGLIDKPPIPGSHPNELTDETKQQIIDLSFKHLTFGQQRIADQLSLEGVLVAQLRCAICGSSRIPMDLQNALNRTLLDEFFGSCFCKKLYETVESLKTDLDKWLNRYNYKHPHRVYHNMSCRSSETVQLGKKRREELMKEAA